MANSWEFPGGLVVRTRRFHCHGLVSVPVQRTKILQATWCSQNKQTKGKLFITSAPSVDTEHWFSSVDPQNSTIEQVPRQPVRNVSLWATHLLRTHTLPMECALYFTMPHFIFTLFFFLCLTLVWLALEFFPVPIQGPSLDSLSPGIWLRPGTWPSACAPFSCNLFTKYINKSTSCVCVHAQSSLTLGNPMDCSPPGSYVHGIFQARILEWVAIFFSGGSFLSRDQTCSSCDSCIGRWILYH